MTVTTPLSGDDAPSALQLLLEIALVLLMSVMAEAQQTGVLITSDPLAGSLPAVVH